VPTNINASAKVATRASREIVYRPLSRVSQLMSDIAGDPHNPSSVNPKRAPAIDRLASPVRPSQRAIMRQRWRDLLFVHWPFEPQAVRPLIPPHLELDLVDGKAYVGLVLFTMTGVRPVGLPAVAGISSFHETNVRTYVRVADCDPGVWFFSLDAASAIAVRLARWLFYLPYHYARMFLEHEVTSEAHLRSFTRGRGIGQVPCPPPTPFGLNPKAQSNRLSLDRSTVSWSNGTSFLLSVTIGSIMAESSTLPILFNQQEFSLSTKLS
jgi:hypothetical protein